jgi:hypothetical protein
MKEILKRLKLIDYLTTTLRASKYDFVNRLSNITDIGSSGMFSDTFDVFSSSKNEFKGQVDLNGFKLKRRRRFFDTSMTFAIAKGTFNENNGQLTIETEINGFHNFIIVFYVFLIIFYSILIFGILREDNKESFVGIPFLLLHGTFMFAIPYFIMRRSVKRLKYELEREFFYLTKNQ